MFSLKSLVLRFFLQFILILLCYTISRILFIYININEFNIPPFFLWTIYGCIFQVCVSMPLFFQWPMQFFYFFLIFRFIIYRTGYIRKYLDWFSWSQTVFSWCLILQILLISRMCKKECREMYFSSWMENTEMNFLICCPFFLYNTGISFWYFLLWSGLYGNRIPLYRQSGW